MIRWSVMTICLLLSGCGAGKEAMKEEMLLGWVERSELFSQSYPRFESGYNATSVDPEVVDLIREFNEGTDWLVFLGTWCSDSYREIPSFLRIADEAGIDSSRIRFYALDRDKESPDRFEGGYDITLVPTIIFVRNGAEMGRIVERSDPSMEDNMIQILIEGGD